MKRPGGFASSSGGPNLNGNQWLMQRNHHHHHHQLQQQQPHQYWSTFGPTNPKRPCLNGSTPLVAAGNGINGGGGSQADAYKRNLLSTDYDHHHPIVLQQQQQQHHQRHLMQQQQLRSAQVVAPSGAAAPTTASSADQSFESPAFFSDLHQSPVVHVSGLAPNTTEAALIHCFADYGVVRDVIVLPSRSAAYLQFNDILAAQSAVAASRGRQRPPTVHGRRLQLQFCRQPGIDHSGALDAGARKSRVLLLVVSDMVPGSPTVTAELVRRVAGAFGRVLRAVVLRRDHVSDTCVQALVEFSTVEESGRAKRHLNGAHVFPESHKLRATFSNQTEIRLAPGAVNDACHYSAELAESPQAPYRASLMDWPRGGGVPPALLCDRAVQTVAESLLLSRRNPTSVEQHQHLQLHQQHQAIGEAALDHQQQQQLLTAIAADDEGAATASAAASHRCLLLHNVPRDRVNCTRLFNLLCLYGNVLRVKFLRNKPDSVMAEFSQPADCSAALRHLAGCPMFGRRLVALPCRQDSVIKHRSVDTLPDGSPAYADFTGSRNNRFVVAGKARRNRLCRPSATLHFFNLPSAVSDAALSDLLAGCGAERPLRIVRFGGGGGSGGSQSAGRFASGLMELPSIEAAVRTVCLANHLPMPQPPASLASDDVTGPSSSATSEQAEQQQQRSDQYLLKLNFSDSAILSATAASTGSGASPVAAARS